MSRNFKNAFDKLKKYGFKKKYYFKNGEEELIFYNTKNTYIELYKVCISSNCYNINVIYEINGIRENIMNSTLIENEITNQLQSNLKCKSFFEQVDLVLKFIEENILKLI